MNDIKLKKSANFILVWLNLILVFASPGFGQEPYRVGTTTANFLEIGMGAAGNAMGDAYVALTTDLMSIYWNPAGLAFMEKSEAYFIHQPFVANIDMAFAGVGLVLPAIGTLALGITNMGYGDDMGVTTMEMPDGTGEKYSASDLALSFSVSRRLVQWFAFGITGKYVSSQIWHSKASAMAVDLGAIVYTNFFSSTTYHNDGLKIGMSIANYGTRMSYDGLDLLERIDPSPNESGNYGDVPGKYQVRGWELPLLFRIGVALHKHITATNRFTLAVDALHPNNNSEFINVGAEYKLTIPIVGDFFLRGGYKGLAMSESEYGPTFGAGFLLTISPSLRIKLDFAYRSIGILGNSYTYGLGILF